MNILERFFGHTSQEDNKSKRWEIFLACIMLFFMYMMARYAPQMVDNKESGKGERVVVIDAGHGGVDPGKVAINRALEKDINLSIAQKLKVMLQEEKITVIMTRNEDNGLYDEGDRNKKIADMKKRCAIVNEANPDLLVSIHQNSYQSESVKGSQVFYYEKSEDGKRLGEILQNSLIKQVDQSNNRTAKSNNNYYMLLHVQCPAVIVECGFLSNWREAEKLKTDEYQEKIAQALKKGILEYLDK